MDGIAVTKVGWPCRESVVNIVIWHRASLQELSHCTRQNQIQLDNRRSSRDVNWLHFAIQV